MCRAAVDDSFWQLGATGTGRASFRPDDPVAVDGASHLE
jgi:hypothetical protein